MQAKISPNEKNAIEQPPTTNLTAFDLYSRAKSLLLTTTLSASSDIDLRKAIELLEEAVKHDLSFFDAYCQLAYTHEQLYAVIGSDHTPARLAIVEAAVQAATRLRPAAPETHLARAQYLYYGLRDYGGALAELEMARQALPNDPRLFELTGYILRRRGQLEEGLRNLERAVELDPRNSFTLHQIAGSYQFPGGAMPRRSLPWIARWRSCPTTSTRAASGQNINSIGKETRDSSTMIFSGALWSNAIRLRPNKHSSRWATMSAGVKG